MIEDWRKSIDHIDQELINLLEQRFALTHKIGTYKKQHHLEVLDVTREMFILNSVENTVKLKAYESPIKDVFTAMMKASRIGQKDGLATCQLEQLNSHSVILRAEKIPANLEESPSQNLRGAYQGTQGAYAEEAFNTYFKQYSGDQPLEKIAVHDFEGVVEGVSKGFYDFGVLPIENTTTGGILPVYDLLQKHPVTIVGEVLIPIEHQLLVVPGTKIEDIQVVYSHPQALRQSRRFLRAGGWQLQPFVNTALSAQWVAEQGDRTKAAVGSKRAGDVFGLDILSQKINDHSGNMTRFIVITGEGNRKASLALKSLPANLYAVREGYKGKTSVIVTVPHVCGSLYRVIACLKQHDVNMLKIESRPLMDHPFEYSFHIDLEGYEHEAPVKDAIQELRSIVQTMKLLGSYTDHSGILKRAQ